MLLRFTMWVRLLKYIKFILYDLKIIKMHALTDKIEYLLIKNISIYNNLNLQTKVDKFIEIDIITFTKVLSEHNVFDIYNNRTNVRPISEDRLYNLSYLMWCTDNGRILSNEREAILLFLKEALIFVIRYNEIVKDLENNIGYGNSMKLKPYIINVNMIINTLGGVDM